MFTANDVAVEIRKIADESPDYVYTAFNDDAIDCMYTENMDGSDGGCIVGRALQHLDVSKESLKKMDGIAASAVIRDILGITEIEYNISDVKNSLMWIDFVQSEQDFGRPWGYAVRNADESLADVKRP